MTPVKRVPPEILALIPDFWDTRYDGGEYDLVPLTHVCQSWREVFISRSCLWTNLDCEDEDQAHVYLKRSKSLPLNLSLRTDENYCNHPFPDIIPHAIGRLRSLHIEGTSGNLEDFTKHLFRPAPLLEKLSICGSYKRRPFFNPVLTPTLFNGDLSSLRSLCLESVCTGLPWRNMINLTSFKLFYVSLDGVTVSHFIDFFEGAPHLREVDLYFATPIYGARDDRLASPVYLERMRVTGGYRASRLLNHLLVPVGARSTIEVDLPSPPIKDRPPKFLENLRNLPNFTTVNLSSPNDRKPHMQFNGPNGQVKVILSIPRVDETCLVLESLDQFDTSSVERLTISRGNSPSGDLPYRALLPMKHLRTLILRQFANPHVFIHALHPTASPSGVMVCPELEELIIMFDGITVDMESVIGVVAARASRGAKLKSVRIFGKDKLVGIDVLELKKHILHLEYGPECGNDGDDTDEED